MEAKQVAGFLANERLSMNRFERERQALVASGRPVFDLTETNQTKTGLLYPEEILKALAAEYFVSRRYEPDAKGLLTAREAIAAYYKQRSLDIPPEQIFITASTSEAYRLLFSLLCDPGDNVLSPAVTYPLFDLLALDQRISCLPFAMLEEQGWAIDEESLKRTKNGRSRALLLVSPHNPTGAVIKERSEAIASLGLPIVADEVFSEFAWLEPAPALASLYPDLAVFHLNGISKMLALPDLKLGWIALNERAYREFGARLEILNDLYLGANQFSQFALPALLERGRAFVSTMRETFQANIATALRLLEACPVCRVRPPHGAPFLFPRFEIRADEEELALELMRHGVIVHPGYFYGCEEGVHFMIACLNKREILEVGIDKLISIVTA